MGRTLVICKPDAVERGLAGEIISRIERNLVHGSDSTVAAAREIGIFFPGVS